MSFQEKIEVMTEGGRILVEILKRLKQETRAGKNGSQLNQLAEALIHSYGCESAFKNYQPPFAKKPYPYALCLSLNETIVHGFPTKNTKIKDGDIVKLDLGLKYKNLYLDAAITVGVGEITPEAKKLIEVTRKSLRQAIKVAKPGQTVGDIGWMIESTLVDAGFTPIKNLCGHDIGEELHGQLQILNYGDPGTGAKIKPEMIFTLEPMAAVSSEYGRPENDFVFKTENGSVATHFEATVAITEKGNIILTPVLDI